MGCDRVTEQQLTNCLCVTCVTGGCIDYCSALIPLPSLPRVVVQVSQAGGGPEEEVLEEEEEREDGAA